MVPRIARTLSVVQFPARSTGNQLLTYAGCHTQVETPEARVRRIWRNADAVAFDVSTVCRNQALDDLAARLGVGEAVAEITRKAMNGKARFREALVSRLEVMRPTYEQLEKFAHENKPKLSPGIRELVALLHRRGTDVFLVSGGLRRLIEPVADMLGIDRKRIYANQILFDKNKNYAGFDENEPTSDSGSKNVGKPAVMTLLKQMGYKQLVMVGDGATDLEAAPPADAFIGFGGNQNRRIVRIRADWFVTDFDDLRDALKWDLTVPY